MLGSLAVGSGRLGVAVGVVVAWLLVLGGGSAWATTGHTFAGQFGGAGAGNGQFGEPLGNGPAGVAVMPSSGEVFTIDAAQGPGTTIVPRVQRFGPVGVFASSFVLDPFFEGGLSGLAVDPVSGAVYVATGVGGGGGVPSVVKYTSTGEVAYALDASSSGVSINADAKVAVDPVDGTVFVTASSTLTGAPGIASFNSSGGFVAFFDNSTEGGFGCLASSLAVDNLHQIYVLTPCTGRVDRFNAVFGAIVDDGVSRGVPKAVAVDPVSDEVYVAEKKPDPLVGLQVTQFTVGGDGVVYTFDASNAVDAVDVRGMAVSGVGTVYTADATKPFVQRFTRFEGPTVVTGDAPSGTVGARSAVLEATIDPEGVDASYHFEYGTDRAYGSRTAEVAVGSGSSAVSAVGTLDSLQPNKEYHYRVVGSNASGSIVGADATFTTSATPADVDGSPPFASAIGPRSARVNSTVNPNNTATAGFGWVEYRFEYGTTAAYGSTTSVGILGGVGGDFLPASAALSGLLPGTTYHFRVVGDNGLGLQFGADQTFVTAPAAGGGATGVTAGRATLTGTINPHGVATSYHFNYGPTSSYGSSTSEVGAGAGDGDQSVSQAVSGLLPDTTYHVQVVATSTNGVVRTGADGLFRTAPAPTAEVLGPTGVSTDAATLAGEVNTYGLTGSYRFDVWSLDSAYAVSTASRPVAGNGSVERVGAAVSGLPAGETLVVQLTATSNDSSGVSDLLTFATPPVPKVFPIPPDSDPYGCGSPRLNAYNGKPKPGETITIGGQDLGVGGSVVLGDRSLKPRDWSSTGFKVVVPEDAVGALALTVDCGRRSNTIAVAMFAEPDNGFAVTGRSVAGSSATLRVRVPGPGKLESFGSSTKAVKVTVKKSSTASLKVSLTATATRALRRSKSGRRTVSVRVRFTPAGGRSASKSVTLTFKRGGGR